MKNTILIVEDDDYINNMIFDAMKLAGYECVQAFSGTEGILRVQNGGIDLVLLDLMLPGKTGEEVIKEIKKICDVPVIVVSAKDSVDSKIELLRLGADDYLTKPFDIKELEVRIEVRLRRHLEKMERSGSDSVDILKDSINNQDYIENSSQCDNFNQNRNELNNSNQSKNKNCNPNNTESNNQNNNQNNNRANNPDNNSHDCSNIDPNGCINNDKNFDRTKENSSSSIFYKEIELNPEDYYVRINNNKLDLTKHEFRILELLIKNPGRAFSKQAIYDYAWDDMYLGEDKTINVHISNLRKKIKCFTDTEYIDTIWGIGFKLAE